jgi:hypothetical protein
MSDIAELFARDPLSLSDPDIDVLIAHYRKARENFLLGDAKAGKSPARKEKAPPKNLDISGINLDDLGI